MQSLTRRQAEILAMIQNSLKETGMPPTRSEIAAHFGFASTHAADKHLQALARKGAIELLGGHSRGIRLRQPLSSGLPMVGHVAAGAPILAEEYIEDHFDIDPRLFQPSADYLLRVHGDSMKDAGILDGDLVAVHKTHQARDGQIIVARINGEVTVKRLRKTPKQIRLLPENPDFKPIIVTARSGDFSIEGIVVGSIRNGYPV